MALIPYEIWATLIWGPRKILQKIQGSITQKNDMKALQLGAVVVYYLSLIKSRDTMPYIGMNTYTIQTPKRSFELHTWEWLSCQLDTTQHIS